MASTNFRASRSAKAAHQSTKSVTMSELPRTHSVHAKLALQSGQALLLSTPAAGPLFSIAGAQTPCTVSTVVTAGSLPSVLGVENERVRPTGERVTNPDCALEIPSSAFSESLSAPRRNLSRELLQGATGAGRMPIDSAAMELVASPPVAINSPPEGTRPQLNIHASSVAANEFPPSSPGTSGAATALSALFSMEDVASRAGRKQSSVDAADLLRTLADGDDSAGLGAMRPVEISSRRDLKKHLHVSLFTLPGPAKDGKDNDADLATDPPADPDCNVQDSSLVTRQARARDLDSALRQQITDESNFFSPSAGTASSIVGRGRGRNRGTASKGEQQMDGEGDKAGTGEGSASGQESNSGTAASAIGASGVGAGQSSSVPTGSSDNVGTSRSSKRIGSQKRRHYDADSDDDEREAMGRRPKQRRHASEQAAPAGGSRKAAATPAGSGSGGSPAPTLTGPGRKAAGKGSARASPAPAVSASDGISADKNDSAPTPEAGRLGAGDDVLAGYPVPPAGGSEGGAGAPDYLPAAKPHPNWIVWQPGMSRYLGVSRGTGPNGKPTWFATVSLSAVNAKGKGPKRLGSHYALREKAEGYYVSRSLQYGIDPETKFRKGWPGDEEAMLKEARAGIDFPSGFPVNEMNAIFGEQAVVAARQRSSAILAGTYVHVPIPMPAPKVMPADEHVEEEGKEDVSALASGEATAGASAISQPSFNSVRPYKPRRADAVSAVGEEDHTPVAVGKGKGTGLGKGTSSGSKKRSRNEGDEWGHAAAEEGVGAAWSGERYAGQEADETDGAFAVASAGRSYTRRRRRLARVRQSIIGLQDGSRDALEAEGQDDGEGGEYAEEGGEGDRASGLTAPPGLDGSGDLGYSAPAGEGVGQGQEGEDHGYERVMVDGRPGYLMTSSNARGSSQRQPPAGYVYSGQPLSAGHVTPYSHGSHQGYAWGDGFTFQQHQYAAMQQQQQQMSAYHVAMQGIQAPFSYASSQGAMHPMHMGQRQPTMVDQYGRVTSMPTPYGYNGQLYSASHMVQHAGGYQYAGSGATTGHTPVHSMQSVGGEMQGQAQALAGHGDAGTGDASVHALQHDGGGHSNDLDGDLLDESGLGMSGGLASDEVSQGSPAGGTGAGPVAEPPSALARAADAATPALMHHEGVEEASSANSSGARPLSRGPLPSGLLGKGGHLPGPLAYAYAGPGMVMPVALGMTQSGSFSVPHNYYRHPAPGSGAGFVGQPGPAVGGAYASPPSFLPPSNSPLNLGTDKMGMPASGPPGLAGGQAAAEVM